MKEATSLDPASIRARIDEMTAQLRNERGITEWKHILDRSRQALDLATHAGYDLGRARALCGLAFANYNRWEHKQALVEAQEAREIFERLGDNEWLPEALMVTCLVEWSLGNYDHALESGIKAMRLYEQIGSAEGLAWSYAAAGGVALDLGQHQQALTYLLESIEIFDKLGNTLGKARAYTGLGAVYQALKVSEAALTVHRECLELSRSLGNALGESRALNDIGAIYQDQGQYDKALEHHQASLALAERIENPQALVTSMLNVGRIYRLTHRLGEAEQALSRALEMAVQLGLKPKVAQAHQELSELCARLEQYEQAWRHYKSFFRARDEVFKDEANTRLRNLQISFEVEQSQKEAEIYRLKNVELARLLDELQAAQAQLVQAAKMAALGDLVASVSHEINSPLGVISSAAQLNQSLGKRLLSGGLDEKGAQVFLENSKATEAAAARIGRIVRSLKGFARLDEAEYQLTDLRRGLDETLTLLEPKYRGRITVQRELDQIPPIYCYAAELNQVFRVVLENAIEAIDGAGVICIRTAAVDAAIEIRFADTGRGISAEQRERLFHPSLRSTGTRVEARMGLFGAYHIVRKHGGEIRVESQPGAGATFTIALPMRLEPAI